MVSAPQTFVLPRTRWVGAIRPSSLALSAPFQWVYTFDLEGRLTVAHEHGITYQRALDGRVVAKRIVGGPEGRQRMRRDLEAAEASALIDRVQACVREARCDLPADGPVSDLAEVLERVARSDFAALEASAARFREIYQPVGILPPDQYLSIVLQAVIGCSWNRCSFCEFYRRVPFRIRDEAEFREHALAVREFFGRAVSYRRSLFLGDGNALVIPRDSLEAALRIARETFSDGPREFFAFADVKGVLQKTSRDYAALRELGLRRAYLGFETGDAVLYRFLRKPGSPAEARQAVVLLKGGGIAVGAIFMAGVGGRKHAEAHVRETIRLIEDFGLGPDDIVYLSPFVDHPGSEYSRFAAAEGVEPLSQREVYAQLEAIRAGLPFAGPPPRVTLYDIHEFLY